MRLGPGTSRRTAFLIGATMLAVSTPALAIDLGPGGERERVLQRQIIDLQAYQNRQRRVDFDDRQQRLRAQDRRQVVRQPAEPSKPRYGTTCRTGASGNSYLSTCR